MVFAPAATAASMAWPAWSAGVSKLTMLVARKTMLLAQRQSALETGNGVGLGKLSCVSEMLLVCNLDTCGPTMTSAMQLTPSWLLALHAGGITRHYAGGR